MLFFEWVMLWGLWFELEMCSDSLFTAVVYNLFNLLFAINLFYLCLYVKIGSNNNEFHILSLFSTFWIPACVIHSISRPLNRLPRTVPCPHYSSNRTADLTFPFRFDYPHNRLSSEQTLRVSEASGSIPSTKTRRQNNEALPKHT